VAVSIPKLNRIQPTSGMPSNDRINMRVQDQGSEILQQTNSVVQVGNKVGDIYQEYENDTIDTLSNQAEKEFTAWNTAELQKLNNYEGDPTDAYVEYDKKVKEKYDSMVSSRPNVSERVKRHVGARLDKVVSGQNVAALKQRGKQQEVFDNNMFESTVKLKKDNMPITAGYVQKDDPGSYLMFDQSMGDIKTLVAKQGMKRGTVTRLPDDAKSWSHAYVDDDGKTVKVQMTDIAKARVAKELSEGVKTSLDVMIAGGQVEEAKAMQERYKGYLDPMSAVKIQEKFATTDRKNEAYKFIGSIRNKSDDAQIAAIDSIQDPELRSEALKIKDADDAKLQSMRDRKAKTNYDTLASSVIKKMNSDSPYYGIAELENDPLYKQTWDNLDAKGKKAVIEMVQSPKETSPKAEARVQNLFIGGDRSNDIGAMSPEDFQAQLSGLSSSDRSKYTTMYNNLRVQSASEQRSTYKRAGQFLRDQFIADGHIERDKFGKITGDDEITMIKAQSALIDHLDTYGGTMDEKQLKDFVKDFSAAEIKGRVFNPTPRAAFRPKNDTTASPQDVTVSPQELTRLKRDYRQQNGYFPPNSDEKFKAYVQKNANRG
jgi:hypothetical protein